MLMECVIAPAHWWRCTRPKCVSGLRRLEKTLNFLRCTHVIDLVLKYGSDINERNWLQLHFYFILFISIAAPVIGVIGMSFFQLCLRFKIEGCSFCTFTQTFAIWFQKRFDNECVDFWAFCYKTASFLDVTSVWTESSKN